VLLPPDPRRGGRLEIDPEDVVHPGLLGGEGAAQEAGCAGDDIIEGRGDRWGTRTGA
jgi:hypothetical protein